MNKKIINKAAFVLSCSLFFTACYTPVALEKNDYPETPEAYSQSTDTTNSADLSWRNYFTDKHLVALIDTALKNNPDVLNTIQDIEIARNNVNIKKAALLPSVSAGLGLSVDKVGRYTSEGAGDASTEITPGKKVPDPLSDISLGFQASWEADIWGKLRNAKKAAYAKYLNSVEGKNWVTTNLIAEISNAYFELLALDKQLSIIKQSIRIQEDELEIVKIQKQASVVTELAVKQFEAQLYRAQSMEFEVLQNITEAENKINFLLGRYPQQIIRDSTAFTSGYPMNVHAGLPVQLLKNRPDIKQAELELLSAKCEVKVAKAEFYPSLGFDGGLGIRSFKPSYLLTMPESLIFSMAGNFITPIINRNAIKAEYNMANARQLQAIYEYRKTVLDAFREVSNEMSNISNLQRLYEKKSKQVETLNSSIDISKELFKSAKANYLEVLMTQQEALDANLEMIETRRDQLITYANIYKALGGGWK